MSRRPETESGGSAPQHERADLPALVYVLTKAQEFCYETPLRGEKQQSAEAVVDPDTPF